MCNLKKGTLRSMKTIGGGGTCLYPIKKNFSLVNQNEPLRL